MTARLPELRDGWGYAVFGRVTVGMDVVDSIAAVPTGSRGDHRDVPVDPVVIESVTRLPWAAPRHRLTRHPQVQEQPDDYLEKPAWATS